MYNVTAFIAALLTTLLETGGGPESSCYLALGCDLAKWNTISGVLVKHGLIKVSNHFVTLTDAGREVAIKLDAALETHKARQLQQAAVNRAQAN